MTSRSENKIVIMDGSMGQYMSINGLPNDDLFKKCWSARALIDPNYHQLVVDAHKAYIEAGADLIETNSYGVQPTYYRRVYGEEYKEKMLHDAKLATQLAVRARTECGKEDVRVIASIPPLSESYRPDLFMELLDSEGKEFIIENFRCLAKAALAGGADALMLENMVSVEEALHALEAVRDFNLPLIVTLQAVTTAPETTPDLMRQLLDFDIYGSRLEAIGFSCAQPEAILECLIAIEDDKDLSEKLKSSQTQLAVLPNLNDTKDFFEYFSKFTTLTIIKTPKRDEMHDETSSLFITFCNLLIEHGSTYIGACCGSTPKNIDSLKQYLNGTLG